MIPATVQVPVIICVSSIESMNGSINMALVVKSAGYLGEPESIGNKRVVIANGPITTHQY